MCLLNGGKSKALVLTREKGTLRFYCPKAQKVLVLSEMAGVELFYANQLEFVDGGWDVLHECLMR